MRSGPILLLAVLLVGGNHQAMTVESPLPGVPISQEHHHHLVIENSYVKAYEVEVAPRESTLMHQHVHDYVYLVFGDAEITNAVAGKPEVSLKQPDLAVNFSPGPFAHIARNNAKTPFRNITIELLRRQGEVKRFYPTVNEALGDGRHGGGKPGSETVLETSEMRVQAVGVGAKSEWVTPVDGHNRLIVITDKIYDTSGKKEANSPFPAGMLVWVPAGTDGKISNPNLKIEKLMVMEFKD